ncbi:MAG TPA: hypothetical protein VES88_04405 [Gemmatimonadaceae bacterium]|nr:hypothetical protein [Gemmatimonadaceae bacterium]
MILNVRLTIAIGLLLSIYSPTSALSQATSSPPAIKDTVVAASTAYEAGGLHRALLGDNYRDLWETPISVPVLDLRRFAGGIKPTKMGGGKQSNNLRFMAPDSSEYVFRPIYKRLLSMPDYFDGTIIKSIGLDLRSASHPTAPVAAPPFLNATGVLHPNPTVVMMPDDPLLGEFRKEFGGILGTIEEYPSTPHPTPAFARAVDITNTEDLLKNINKEPVHVVDARAMLTVRLVDMLLNDNDRHPGQWKWARLRPGGPWFPISRDRDKVFVSYGGTLLGLARLALPSLVTFDSTYPPITGLFDNAIEFDRRLLVGLEKSVWDSVARSIVQRVNDSVIEEAVRGMPREYAGTFAEIVARLKARRDQLPATALGYYQTLFSVADVHATDGDELATAVRSGDGFVDVSLQSGSNPPYFVRRFDARETREIRLYLHGGNDVALVTGRVQQSIPVRIIGGNGENSMVDSSTVGGRSNPTRLYDVGSVSGVRYEPDTTENADKTDKPDVAGAQGKADKPKEEGKEKEEEEVDESLLDFNRRPWVSAYGTLIPPKRDRGTSIRPVVGIKTGHGLGLVPKIGIARYKYGFRKIPYASMIKATAAYSTTIRGFDIGLDTDNRFAESGLHIPTAARMTQLEVVEFRGFGNDVPNLTGDFYDVRQRQWSFRPAVGFSFGPESDVSLGPIVRYTTTDSAVNRFIAQERPYGFATFGQAGLQLKLYHDTRMTIDTGVTKGPFTVIPPEDPPFWGTLDLTGSYYPGMWDAESAYEELAAVATAYLTVPMLTRPVVALRAGGKKLFGEFPYFDAAFIGGSNSLRTEHRQRYAGAASLYGSGELRVPIAKFPLILPLDVGALGFVDMARVYVDGESPGGWHKGTGAGFWIGIIRPETSLTVLYTNNPDRRVLTSLGFAF